MNSNSVYFVIPGDIEARTGGYRYDKRIMHELSELGWAVHLVSLDGDYPFPSTEQLLDASAELSRITDGNLVVIDGLAFSVMPDVIKAHKHRLSIVALIHHPLALETGLTADQQAHLENTETLALAQVNRVITTSKNTAESLADYNVMADQITAVLPGTDRGKLATGSQSDSLNLLCVATLTPRKGHAVLLDALAPLLKYPWHLRCAGSVDRDADTHSRLCDQIIRHEMSSRVSLIGELDDHQLSEAYEQADIFVLASFHEGYGMVLDEAIAHGLPIVCTNAGAMKDTVPAGSAVLVPPNDSQALSEALRSVLSDTALRQKLTQQATHARLQLRSWKQAATHFSNALTIP